MAQYEKKMMKFEAFRYNGSLSRPSEEKYFNERMHAPVWAAKAVINGILFFEDQGEGKRMELYARHPDGEVSHIPVGYYIIRWSDTELYPCEPNLFEASYVLVNKGEQSNLAIPGVHRTWEEQRRELEEAVKPVCEWLCKHGDPYMTVVVTQDRATVHQEYMSTPLLIPD